MKLSIITINYNNKGGLEKTIASVMQQTWRDFEWILIDGGSTDGSKEVIENLAKNPDANISYWCSEPDGGIYQALNKGVTFAHGEYVNFMNAGDAFHDEHVLAEVFRQNPTADILYGDTLSIYNDYQERDNSPETLTLSWFWSIHTLCHQSTFTKLSIFDNIIFDTKYRILADRKFWLECIMRNYKFQHYPIIIADYDCSGFSIQNFGKWEGELTSMINEVIPTVIKKDIDSYSLYRKTLFMKMEDVSSYGSGTLYVYRLINRTFFKLMKIRTFSACMNFLYKIFKSK